MPTQEKTWSLREILHWISQYFQQNNIEQSQLEAEEICAFVLGCPRLEIFLKLDSVVEETSRAQLRELVKKRVGQRIPLAYLLGNTNFMGLEIAVEPSVLIPRPETELLVEKSVQVLKNYSLPVVVDLGTGSGNIAIALTKFLPQIKVYAIDLNAEILKLAHTNAAYHSVLSKITFLKGDLTAPLKNFNLKGKITAFVSNPPYIPSEEISALSAEVQKEPVLALDGGRQGLDYYRRIFSEAYLYLEDSGWLIVEIGAGQRNDVENLLKVNGYAMEQVLKDYQGWERVLVARKNSVCVSIQCQQ